PIVGVAACANPRQIFVDFSVAVVVEAIANFVGRTAGTHTSNLTASAGPGAEVANAHAAEAAENLRAASIAADRLWRMADTIAPAKEAVSTTARIARAGIVHAIVAAFAIGVLLALLDRGGHAFVDL